MSLDLSDLIEERFPSEPQPQTSAPIRGSLAVPIDKKAALARSQKGQRLIQSGYWQNKAGDEQASNWESGDLAMDATASFWCVRFSTPTATSFRDAIGGYLVGAVVV